MKVAPVSADLLIKIGMGVAAVAVAYVVFKKGARSLGEALDALKNLPSDLARKASQVAADSVDAVLTPRTVMDVMLPSDTTITTGENYGHEGRNYEKPAIGWNNIGVTGWGITG